MSRVVEHFGLLQVLSALPSATKVNKKEETTSIPWNCLRQSIRVQWECYRYGTEVGNTVWTCKKRVLSTQ